MTNTTLTAIDGIRVGHATDLAQMTGCSVVVCPPETVGGVDQRGGAPGTRETDLLRPMHLVEHVHALVLSGGSAFGLRVADGVMDYCREQEIGFPTGSGVPVPIVPAAILYDLEIGTPEAPTLQMGYDAVANATDTPVSSGNVGAGTGCTIGKLAGMGQATKAGLGNAAIHLPNGVIVAAMFAVNAIGDVINPDGTVLGGLRGAESGTFVGSLNALAAMPPPQPPTSNTLIGVIVTNAKLTKEQVNKVAQMAHDGLARTVSPAHTLYDGDTIFALATGQIEADVNQVGAFAAEATAAAIHNGVVTATTLGGVRAYNA